MKLIGKIYRFVSTSRILPFFLLAATWTLLAINTPLRQHNRELLQSRQYPPLIRGLRIDVEPFTTLQSEWHPATGVAPLRQLLLAFEGSCFHCRNNLANWQKLLGTISEETRVAVTLISLDGATPDPSLLSILKAHGISYKAVRTRSTSTFTTDTGIVGIPATVILDANKRIVMVYSGELHDTTLAAFNKALASSPYSLAALSIKKRD